MVCLPLLALMLGAASHSPQEPCLLGQPETLRYALSYFHVVAGSLELSVQPMAEGLKLSMVATSTPAFSRIFTVDNHLETVLQRNPLSLLRAQARIHEGKRRYQEEVVVDLASGKAQRGRNGQAREPVDVPFPVLDTLGAIFALRTFPLAPSRAFSLDVLSGKGVYPLLVVVTGRQSLKLPSGKVEALVVEPRFRQGGLYKAESKLTLLVSTDWRRVPLRIVSQLPFGSITATLVEAAPPWPPPVVE